LWKLIILVDTAGAGSYLLGLPHQPPN